MLFLSALIVTDVGEALKILMKKKNIQMVDLMGQYNKIKNQLIKI